MYRLVDVNLFIRALSYDILLLLFFLSILGKFRTNCEQVERVQAQKHRNSNKNNSDDGGNFLCVDVASF